MKIQKFKIHLWTCQEWFGDVSSLLHPLKTALNGLQHWGWVLLTRFLRPHQELQVHLSSWLHLSENNNYSRRGIGVARGRGAPGGWGSAPNPGKNVAGVSAPDTAGGSRAQTPCWTASLLRHCVFFDIAYFLWHKHTRYCVHFNFDIAYISLLRSFEGKTGTTLYRSLTVIPARNKFTWVFFFFILRFKIPSVAESELFFFLRGFTGALATTPWYWTPPHVVVLTSVPMMESRRLSLGTKILDFGKKCPLPSHSGPMFLYSTYT